MAEEKCELGVIGGSGLYGMAELKDVQEVEVETPFGPPSDSITTGELHNTRIAFLPRHGKRHNLTPSEIPYRANIHALKQLGVKYLISVSACGSLKEAYAPGHIVVPDQLVDYTKGKRKGTFFGDGLVAHVGVASPFSPELSSVLAEASRSVNGTVHEGGTFITIEGPRFSTKGESELFRRWGMSLVGMTTSPEAFLATEAEIAYAVMAHVTDYDVWHEEDGPVTVEKVVEILSKNTHLAQSIISELALGQKAWMATFAAHDALKDALSLVSDWSQIPAETRLRLAPIIGKYSGS